MGLTIEFAIEEVPIMARKHTANVDKAEMRRHWYEMMSAKLHGRRELESSELPLSHARVTLIRVSTCRPTRAHMDQSWDYVLDAMKEQQGNLPGLGILSAYPDHLVIESLWKRPGGHGPRRSHTQIKIEAL